jgi:predicted molibdopterin-dependent oxidoreductase YjgC
MSYYSAVTFLKKLDGLIVYQGYFQNDLFKNYANLILPINNFVEGEFFYLNLEGFYRFTNKIITPFKFIYQDYEIIQMLLLLLNMCGNMLNFSVLCKNFKYLKFFKYLIKYFCFFFFSLQISYELNVKKVKVRSKFFFKKNFQFYVKFLNSNFLNLVNNYYSTDSFTNNSKILTLASLSCFMPWFKTII